MLSFFNYYPPVSYYFSLSFSGVPFGSNDAAFQEVSGITATLETQTINEGGQNLFSHKLPGRMSYDDLVLTRGLMVKDSPISDWCWDHLGGGLRETFTPKTVILSLLDSVTSVPIMTWNFVNAYPIKWSAADLKAQDSSIAVETLTLTYNYFTVEADGDFYSGANVGLNSALAAAASAAAAKLA